MRLLVTRPEPDGERTAAELRARGHEAVLAPLLRVEAVANADLGSGPWAAILLTSANGVRGIAGHPRRHELLALPVLAVGPGSAAAARAAGFAEVTSADGDAGDLARLAAARWAGSTRPLLHLAGAERARDLCGALAASGLQVRIAVVYRTAKAVAFQAEVSGMLRAGTVDGVLHFSRRSAEAYLECGRDMPGPALAPMHFCLSARAAEPLQAAGAAKVRVATHPDEAGMLALVTSQP